LFQGEGVYGFLTGCQGQAFGFEKNLPLSPQLVIFSDENQIICSGFQIF
jgi:hypothetical protein